MASGLEGKEVGGRLGRGLRDLLFVAFLEIRAPLIFYELTEYKESTVDLASHAPASTELITRLPKRPQCLLPEQKVSSFWSAILLRGAGNIWLRPLGVSTAAGVNRSPVRKWGWAQGAPRHHGPL